MIGLITPAQRERGEKLRALSEQLKDKAVEWRVDDCSAMPAQWVSDQTGKEFDWPDYTTRDEAEDVIEREGGLIAIWERTARKIGLPEIINERPQIGDVGIIVDNNEVPVGGIFLHGGVIMWRAEVGTRQIAVYGRTYPARVNGIILRKPLLLKAWRV